MKEELPQLQLWNMKKLNLIWLHKDLLTKNHLFY